MTRLTLDMTLVAATLALAEGNLGALKACLELAAVAPTVDPDGGLGAFGPLLTLDELGLYGSDVWVLHSDLCGRDPVLTLAVLRAWQLGLVDRETVRAAVTAGRDRGPTLDPQGLLERVRLVLPEFGR